MNTKIFYNKQRILSYKRLYNLVVGVRGHGKTYEYTKTAIECGLKYKKLSFVVMVRYKEDIINIKEEWWVIVEHLFPEWIFTCMGKKIYASNGIEKFVIGEYVALKQYVREKKKPRPHVKWIIFDECLNEDMDYLDNEINKFLSVCDSIIRNRDDVRVVLIANTISIINPYFDYFGFTRLENSYVKGKYNSILEFTDSVEFIKFRETTKFGSSIKDTEYGNFAMKGEFLLDDTTNVMCPQGKKNYIFSLSLDGIMIDVFNINNVLYLSYNKDRCKRLFTPYVEDAKLNGAMFCEKTFTKFKYLKNMFVNNRITYEHLKIKNSVILFIQFLMGNRYK